jgi:hypothetical protein
MGERKKESRMAKCKGWMGSKLVGSMGTIGCPNWLKLVIPVLSTPVEREWVGKKRGRVGR